MVRTNFYKLSLPELEERLVVLRNFWWLAKDNKVKQMLIDEAISLATEALSNRQAIIENPAKYQALKDMVEVFWDDIPLRYEDTKGN